MGSTRDISRWLAAPVLAVFAVLAACSGSQGGEPFTQEYIGAPYMGPVRVRIVRPDQRGATTDAGRGSIQFTDAGEGKARMIVAGHIRAPGDAGFVADGIVGADGWHSRNGDVRIHIAPDGVISGGGAAPPHRYSFGGAVTREAINLKVGLELMPPSQGGLPAGTRFEFDYVLQRRDVAAADGREADREERDGDCARVEYRLKNVPNPFGGAMSLVQVPECVE